jgi:hypothetical protein
MRLLPLLCFPGVFGFSGKSACAARLKMGGGIPSFGLSMRQAYSRAASLAGLRQAGLAFAPQKQGKCLLKA